MFKITQKQKYIQAYYNELKEFENLNQHDEGTVSLETVGVVGGSKQRHILTEKTLVMSKKSLYDF